MTRSYTIGSADKKVFVWCAESGRLVTTLTSMHSSTISHLVFNPRFMTLASACCQQLVIDFLKRYRNLTDFLGKWNVQFSVFMAADWCRKRLKLSGIEIVFWCSLSGSFIPREFCPFNDFYICSHVFDMIMFIELFKKHFFSQFCTVCECSTHNRIIVTLWIIF